MITTWANLTPLGTHPIGDHAWDDDSSCHCTDCGKRGAVVSFQAPPAIPPLKRFAVAFSEFVEYRSEVDAEDAAHAEHLVETQLANGGPDSLEETHNERSTFEVEEAVS